MPNPQVAFATIERDVRIHPYLWITSQRFLAKGQAESTGSYYEFMASITFSAFTLEAYLNWLGPSLYGHWRYLERLSPNEKLALIADQLHVIVNKGLRPWQTMKGLFDFRNSIAHGKPETLTDLNGSFMEGDIFIRADWEKFITADNASRVREDVGDMIEKLHFAARVPNESADPFVHGIQIRDTTFFPAV